MPERLYDFNKVHTEVLETIEHEGGLAGIAIYEKKKSAYDLLPDTFPEGVNNEDRLDDNYRVSQKLEIVSALQEHEDMYVADVLLSEEASDEEVVDIQIRFLKRGIQTFRDVDEGKFTRPNYEQLDKLDNL
ncbi:hypothetical protein GOV14_03260 [Candidatus Pacearchaeota archaeon]|nr:hypothetical protein [Candidatus Pacearchaeota archaeon]